MAESDPKTPAAISTDAELWRDLRRAAHRLGTPVSKLARTILRDSLDGGGYLRAWLAS